jgi:hypothetical protein
VVAAVGVTAAIPNPYFLVIRNAALLVAAADAALTMARLVRPRRP